MKDEFIESYLVSMKLYLKSKTNKKKYKETSVIEKPYLKWRKAYCEICGPVEDQRILHVHHLNSKLKGTDRDNPSNCITLCFNHHALASYGKYPKWKNRGEFEKWLLSRKKAERIKSLRKGRI
jgi:hypothetical protein